jgi:hypothetical protein
MTQERTYDFADVTMNHQWIHIDVDRAKPESFDRPFAHGHLTLSIMGHLPKTKDITGPSLEGKNYPSTTVSIRLDFHHQYPLPIKFELPVRLSERSLKVE